MNDKEAFEKWHYENISNPPTLNDLIEKAWRDACEHKQKEIDELQKDIKFLLDLHGYDPVCNDQEIISNLKSKYL